MSERILQSAVVAAVSMLEMRRTVRILLGESYRERVAVYSRLVRNRMEDTGLGVMMALQTMLHDGGLSLSSVGVALLVSAAVEISEEEQRAGQLDVATFEIPPLYFMEVAADARSN